MTDSTQQSPHTGPTPAQRLVRRLYVRHSAELLAFFRSARRMARADAADLLQQTFSELLRTLTRREDLQIEHPRAFLFTLATRQLHAMHRRGQRRPVLDGEADPALVAAQDDLEYAASLRDEQRLVLRAMRRLSDGLRRDAATPGEVSSLQLLVYFRFWVGLTLNEVAQILEMSPNAVAGRQRRALQKLQRCIEEIEQETGAASSTSTTMLMRWRDRLEQEARGGGGDSIEAPGGAEG